jgi:hypothetical protein
MVVRLVIGGSASGVASIAAPGGSDPPFDCGPAQKSRRQFNVTLVHIPFRRNEGGEEDASI